MTRQNDDLGLSFQGAVVSLSGRFCDTCCIKTIDQDVLCSGKSQEGTEQFFA